MLEQLSALFPPAASVCIAGSDLALDAWPEEEKLLAHAVAKRRNEFAAGRAAAHAALAKLGAPSTAILINADRTPAWPENFVGSITHCDGFCAAVVAHRHEIESIGFDAEKAVALPEGTDRMIYGPEEASAFSALPVIAGVDWPKLTFSAKEAFYKCFFPVTRARLGFREVAVRFDANGSFAIDALTSDAAAVFLRRPVRGRWQKGDGLVFTSFVLMPG